MKRVWVGAVGLALLLVSVVSLAHALTPEGAQSTFREIRDATRQLSPDQSPVKLSASQGEPGPVAGVSASAASPHTILSEGFESPEPAFAVYGAGWALTDYRQSDGSYSAYCAGMFSAPPGPYVPNMESLLIAGPFDLTLYSSLQLSFDAWADQAVDDVLFAGVSADGYSFNGVNYYGSTEGQWSTQGLDISEYCGEPEVWIMFAFDSDAADQAEGVYLDRVSLAGTPVEALRPVFRFYNFTNGTHFYTPSPQERDAVIAGLSNVYSYDGPSYSTSVFNNSQPLHRFFNRQSGGHFYTASTEEANAVRAKWSDVYQYEGTTYAVNPGPVPDSVPVFRFYNKQNGTHFYTASAEERDMVMARWPNVYGYEGPAFWVGQQQSPSPVSSVAPGDPVDETLWQPSGVSLPVSGNYVYLDSEAGDYIGGGHQYLYTHENASLSISESAGRIRVRIGGDDWWNGEFKIPSGLDQCLVGYYPHLTRYPFHDPAFGGMSWTGEGRGSNTLTGWFFIDRAVYVGGGLTELDMRFEQHSEGAAPALHGKIHWRAADVVPAAPAPNPAWQPGMPLPASGTFIHLDSDVGDWVGGGREYLYTPLDAAISVTETDGRLRVSVDGDEWWDGDFWAPVGDAEFQAGDYPVVGKSPTATTVGLHWFGEGRGASSVTGQFSVDSVTYVNGELTAIELRFEQHSGGKVPALHGEIHWSAADTRVAPGPVNPIPGMLWQPLATPLPRLGNYVYLDSDFGDYIGLGREYLYTEENSSVNVSVSGNIVRVTVGGWTGQFRHMNSIARFEVGYYPGLMRASFCNPAKGGLDWSGQGRGSNELTGWFVIDSVTYTDGVLTAIDLRFEQHSEGRVPALHGVIHWRAGG